MTWNVEWQRTGGRAATVIRDVISRETPDVVCLTEAPADFLGPQGHTITSEADYGYKIVGNRRKVLLWSKEPWRTVDPVGNSELPGGRYVSGVTSTPVGDLLVIGVCIPWSGAHVSTGRRDKRRWEDHISYLRAIEGCLAAHKQRTVVLGDYNQAIPRRTAPMAAYDALRSAILDRFHVATAGPLPPDNSFAIDHVAHTDDLSALGVRTLSPVGPRGEKLSDHLGIALSLRLSTGEGQP